MPGTAPRSRNTPKVLVDGSGPRDGRVIPAGGETSPHDGFDHLAGIALAAHLDVPVRRFPGGHNGNLTHPRAFAQRIGELPAPARVPATGR
ncbi:hypothetical protein [Catellatospora vulcania]|uniref:hypothetical protein n=1 Tax=Catellatospora vulcania TaxID=1460450 RepID=UPI0012D4340C|nr:hypothetical protein [Catellatospora vulcania]